ncbi:F-box protein At3g07870-like [Aegilops tauschii subsp. strangulata]|uniref:F-box protein At3g07870-like n=1 Tax=Aegilops tauschii subsp. strangulata TaxID=200361 RepID=UPI003CC892D8
MESVAVDILQEILLRLPTRDAARCSCVSRLWRHAVIDPSFRSLHARARHVVSGAGAEALLVSEIRTPGKPLEATVFMASSGKAMCRLPHLASGYNLVNACNGFLLLACGAKNSPVFVCNPVTGEKLEIPPPPDTTFTHWRMYAMGFSPSTQQYKLFRFSYTAEPEVIHLDVCTLGDGRGWRPHPYLIRCSAVYGLYSSPRVLVDGRLFWVVQRSGRVLGPPDRILVIDVASETHGTYCLPDKHTQGKGAVVHTLELRGRLCVVVHVGDQLHFRIMHRLGPRLHGMDHEWYPMWKLRYTFSMDVYGNDQASGAWFNDADGLLCYGLNDRLYMYDTTKNKKKPQQACGAAGEHSADDADSDEAPAPPKPKKQKKTKASKPPATPKASHAKPLATAPPSVQSQEISHVSKKTEKPKKKKTIKSSG